MEEDETFEIQSQAARFVPTAPTAPTTVQQHVDTVQKDDKARGGPEDNNNDGVVKECGEGGCLAVALAPTFDYFGWGLGVEKIKKLLNAQITGGQNNGVPGDWWLPGCVLSALKEKFGEGNFTFKRVSSPQNNRLYPQLVDDLEGKVWIVDGELSWPSYYFRKDMYTHYEPELPTTSSTSSSPAELNRHCVAIINGQLFDLSLPGGRCSVRAEEVLHLKSDGSFKKTEEHEIMGYFRQIFKVYSVVLPASPSSSVVLSSNSSSRKRPRSAISSSSSAPRKSKQKATETVL